MKRLLACAALLCGAASAHAGIIQADFRTEADLPGFYSYGAKVYQRLHAGVGSGIELDGGDLLANPSGWDGGELWIDLDPLTGILTLSAHDTLDFQLLRITVANIAGSAITGVRRLDDTLTDIGALPSVDFSADALAIVYDVVPGSFNFKGSARFQLLTADAAVPEPAGLALLGLGAGMAGLARCRKGRSRA